MREPVFISGATGYLGRPLAVALLSRGIAVSAVVRAASLARCPLGVSATPGDALLAESFEKSVAGHGVFVHLTGVAHPSPWKARQFREIDQRSFHASLEVARKAGVGHFVYVSVAHPAPVMRAYQAIRRECEEALRLSGLRNTILRPWYVTGPGHRWAEALRPLYRWAEKSERWREPALRLGLLTQEEMLNALLWSVLNPPADTRRVLSVPEMRALPRSDR